ncbi:MAG: hypothetical protein ACOY94_06580, partial [Bacillota bacterium]
GPELLLSLRPMRPARGEPERWDDRFRLPFRLEPRGVSALRAVSARLSLACRARPGAMLLRGRLRLVLETPDGPLALAIPFCRLVAVTASEALSWRARGGLVALACRMEPGGAVVGEATLAVSCHGQLPGAPVPARAPEVAAVRELTGQVVSVSAEHGGEGRVLVRGVLSLELSWADGGGRSRWTGREATFGALLAIPGLQEGDRLVPVAEIDRLSRVGRGAGSRAAALVAVGVTALRTAHLPLEGQWYRLEQVMGQAVATVELEQVLFDPPGPARPAAPCPAATAELPAALAPEGWQQIRLELKPAVAAGDGWRSTLLMTGVDTGGKRHRTQVLLGTSLPAGAEAVVARLDSVGPGHRGVRVRACALPATRGVRLGLEATAEGARTHAALTLPGPLRWIPGLSVSRGATWEARVLARLPGGHRLLATDLEPPPGGAAGRWQPLAATVYSLSLPDEPAERVDLEIDWQRTVP